MSWVKVHYRQVNLGVVAEGLPENNGQDCDMWPFYDAAFELARKSSSGYMKKPEEFVKPKAETSLDRKSVV